jgi:hypothetical protein
MVGDADKDSGDRMLLTPQIAVSVPGTPPHAETNSYRSTEIFPLIATVSITPATAGTDHDLVRSRRAICDVAPRLLLVHRDPARLLANAPECSARPFTVDEFVANRHAKLSNVVVAFSAALTPWCGSRRIERVAQAVFRKVDGAVDLRRRERVDALVKLAGAAFGIHGDQGIRGAVTAP